MELSELFSKSYLFDPIPSRETRLLIPMTILFFLFVVVGIVLRLVKSSPWEIRRRYSKAFWLPGLLGLLYAFGRYEGLAWLGSRISLVAVLTIFLIWQVVTTVWAMRFIPKHLDNKKSEDRYQQYLPRPKTVK